MNVRFDKSSRDGTITAKDVGWSATRKLLIQLTLSGALAPTTTPPLARGRTPSTSAPGSRTAAPGQDCVPPGHLRLGFKFQHGFSMAVSPFHRLSQDLALTWTQPFSTVRVSSSMVARAGKER